MKASTGELTVVGDRYGDADLAERLELTTDALEYALGTGKFVARDRGLALVARNRQTLVDLEVRPTGDVLLDLAERLTPNPALTAAGTLAIILDAIDKIDSDDLARKLAQINRRKEFGFDEGPPTEEQWRSADLKAKVQLIHAAQCLKEALREATK
jgi:hypothetical protein